METILSFFSDLILFTAGLLVVAFWIVIFIEVFDTISEIVKEIRKSTNEDQEV